MHNWVFAVIHLLLLTTKTLGKHSYTFPKNFIFGAATSSYQVEGAWNVDGKGLSIWDRFTHDHPERVLDNTNGDDAAKSYYKYKEDVKALKDMGMQFYRFSISWPRIMPNGLPNEINQKGIDYYNNLINELIKNNIEPLVTMFHWDLPDYLQDLGSWTNEAIVPYFVAYAKVLFENFGDRVKMWITLNEPISTLLGLEYPIFAPSLNLSGMGIYMGMHNMIKSHAQAYHLYNKNFRQKQNGKISLSIPVMWMEPLNISSSSDIEAARISQEFFAGMFLHPIFSKEGDYPQVVKERIANLSFSQGFPNSRLPTFTEAEVEYIRGTADFIGLNEYTTLLASFGQNGPAPSFSSDTGVNTYVAREWPESKTSLWETVAPKSLRNIIKWVKEKYGEHWEILITENGYSDTGHLDDVGRVNYLATYMIEVLKAMYVDHCKVIGYTVWSLIDNFEWMDGYTSHFGLYHVDFNDPERRRTPKLSAEFMTNITKTRTIPDKYIKIDNDLNKLEKSQEHRMKVSKIARLLSKHAP